MACTDLKYHEPSKEEQSLPSLLITGRATAREVVWSSKKHKVLSVGPYSNQGRGTGIRKVSKELSKEHEETSENNKTETKNSTGKEFQWILKFWIHPCLFSTHFYTPTPYKKGKKTKDGFSMIQRTVTCFNALSH